MSMASMQGLYRALEGLTVFFWFWTSRAGLRGGLRGFFSTIGRYYFLEPLGVL